MKIILYTTYPKDENAHSAIEQVFYNRGFKSREEIIHYLNVTEDDLIDPLKLDNMQTGAELLQKHIQNDSNIVLVIDPDCDGYTSAAMLANYIMRAYAQYPLKNFHYFIHDGKQHGIELDKLPDKINLLIIPDASSNDNEQVRQLYELGTEVLILD